MGWGSTEDDKKERAELREGEEILGVYGTKDESGIGAFKNLGFIVWKPP